MGWQDILLTYRNRLRTGLTMIPPKDIIKECSTLMAESEVHGIPGTSNVRGKLIGHWFSNDSTKELIQECFTLMTENGLIGIPISLSKPAKNWFNNDPTKETYSRMLYADD